MVQKPSSTVSTSNASFTTQTASNIPTRFGSSTMDRLVNLASSCHLKKPLLYLKKVWDVLAYILCPQLVPRKHFKLSPKLKTALKRRRVTKPSPIGTDAYGIIAPGSGAKDITVNLMDEQQDSMNVKEKLMEKESSEIGETLAVPINQKSSTRKRRCAGYVSKDVPVGGSHRVLRSAAARKNVAAQWSYTATKTDYFLAIGLIPVPFSMSSP